MLHKIIFCKNKLSKNALHRLLNMEKTANSVKQDLFKRDCIVITLKANINGFEEFSSKLHLFSCLRALCSVMDNDFVFL